MDELLELIARIGTEDPPDDDELSAARNELADLLLAATEGDTRDLETAKALRKAIDDIDLEIKAREAKAEEEDAEIQGLLEGVTPEPETPEEAEEPEEVEAPEASAVAASLSAAVKNARRRIQDKATPPEPTPDVRVRPMGPAQGYPLGQEATLSDVAELFDREARSVTSGKQPLVRLEYEYPEDRILNSKQTLDNTRLIDMVLTEDATSYEGVAAAGGICGPLPADFTHPICGDRGRPIRDALPRFQASRGGIRYAPAITLADVEDAITIWDIATDESPGETEKACLVLDCDDELEAKVDAVVRCLQIGNFQARFNPEFWRSRLALTLVAHDRAAETKAYNEIVAASIATTYAGADGTIYSVLSAVDKAVAGIRSRLRLSRRTGFKMIAPTWTHAALRADIARQNIGGTPQTALAVADQIINSFFSVRGVTPVWSEDVDVFGAQGAGALEDFPGADVDLVVYPEGTFLFLDGGTLDLGTEITDSELNKQNNRQAFAETFEKVVQRGCESLVVTVPVAEVCQCSTEPTSP